NNLVENNVVYWVHGEGISTGIGSGNTIRGNIVSDAWSANIYVDGAPNTTIENNLSYVTSEAKSWPVGNPNTNWPLGIGVSPEPTTRELIDGLIIRNNIVVNANGCVWKFIEEVVQPASNMSVYNNTCVGNASGIKFQNGTTMNNLNIRNNIIVGGLATYDATIQIDPAP